MQDEPIQVKFHDTLRGEKVSFIPREKNKVNMYVCGLTPSNEPHIGHARTAVIFDIIQRIFIHFGYEVVYCSNFTDIDDKIIARSKEEKCSPGELAEKYINAYLEAMGKLNIKLPSCFARVTQHVPEIIEIVSTLIKKGFAYESEGDVYFRVRSFKSYGKLSKRSIKELLVGARIEPDEKKQDPLDFALWKSAKPGEPFWESPWGKGRPGWHIECSAMALKYLNASFDIHGGAQDLIFPHHENEIAQAEAYTGIEPFSRYWIHAGWVTLNKEKMSKSIGNVFRMKEAFSLFHPNILRFFFISTLYSSPLDYDLKGLHQAGKAFERVVQTLQRLKTFVDSAVDSTSSADAQTYLNELNSEFDLALADNFNTPLAISYIMMAVKEANRRTDEGKIKPGDANLFYQQILRFLKILGFEQPEKTLFAQIDPAKLQDHLAKLMEKHQLPSQTDLSIDDQVQSLIELRKKSREERKYDLADQIREDLADINIYLEDSKEGTRYRIFKEA